MPLIAVSSQLLSQNQWPKCRFWGYLSKKLESKGRSEPKHEVLYMLRDRSMLWSGNKVTNDSDSPSLVLKEQREQPEGRIQTVNANAPVCVCLCGSRTKKSSFLRTQVDTWGEKNNCFFLRCFGTMHSFQNLKCNPRKQG